MKKSTLLITILLLSISANAQFFNRSNEAYLLYDFSKPPKIFSEIANDALIQKSHDPIYVWDFSKVASKKESELFLKKNIYTDSISVEAFDTKTKDLALRYTYIKKDGGLVLDRIRKSNEFYTEGRGNNLSRDTSWYSEKMGEYAFCARFSKGISEWTFLINPADGNDSMKVIISMDPLTYKKRGVVSKKFKLLIPCIYTSLYIMDGTLIAGNEAEKQGVLNIAGDTLVPLEYSFIVPEANAYKVLLDGEKYSSSYGYDQNFGLVSKKGVLVTRATSFYFVDFEKYEYCAYRSGDLYGFFDKNGEVILSPKYKEARNFSNGLAAVKNEKSLWGYVNLKGELVIPCQYIYAGEFTDGKAIVEDSKTNYQIDQSGKILKTY